jgi:hypothetical protein
MDNLAAVEVADRLLGDNSRQPRLSSSAACLGAKLHTCLASPWPPCVHAGRTISHIPDLYARFDERAASDRAEIAGAGSLVECGPGERASPGVVPLL